MVGVDQRVRETQLIERYRGIICDLDGVVYHGTVAIPGAVETLMELSRRGVAIVFATNNASRHPEDVHAALSRLGLDLPFERAPVITSAQAAAELVAERYAPGTEVLAVGGRGVFDALTEAGLSPLSGADSLRTGTFPTVVVQGAGADVSWIDLARASGAIHQGALWIATNLDMTIPMAWGLAPGNGSLVAAVTSATSQRPAVVVGKPHAFLYRHAVKLLRLPRSQILAVGDRLDTDIAGARLADLDSLLVMTGVSTPSDLEMTPEEAKPTFVANDLAGLLQPSSPT